MMILDKAIPTSLHKAERLRRERINQFDSYDVMMFEDREGIKWEDEESVEVWGDWLAKKHGFRLVVIDIDNSQALDKLFYVHQGAFVDQCANAFVGRLVYRGQRYYFSTLNLTCFTYPSGKIGLCVPCGRLYTGRDSADNRSCLLTQHNCELFKMTEALEKRKRSLQLAGMSDPKRTRLSRDPALFYQRKRSVLTINIDVGLCCAAALCVAMDNSIYRNINPLRIRARDLHNNAGVDVGPCGREELDKFQKFLAPNFMIHVVYKQMGNQVGYRGDDKLFEEVDPENITHLYLHFNDYHYDVIKNVRVFFVKPKYCPLCEMASCRSTHVCKKMCMGCKQSVLQCQGETLSPSLPCALCHRQFQSQECFDDHLKKKNKLIKKMYRAKVQTTPQGAVGEEEEEEDEDDEMEDNQQESRERDEDEDEDEVEEELTENTGPCVMYSVCERYQRCVKCFKEIDLKVKKPKKLFWRRMTMHQCGEMYCPNCKSFAVDPHWCYIQKVAEKKSALLKMKWIVFDFESYAYEQDNIHEVELVKALHICYHCQSLPLDAPCEFFDEEKRMQTFYSLDEFMKWLVCPSNSDTTCVAHNLRSYDGQFCCQWLVNHGFVPQIIMNGGSVMLMTLPRLGITFKDSLNFIPASLSKLPALFQLPDTKGFFPHKFNVKANKGYVGPMPAAEFYSPEFMESKARREFESWYQEHQNDEFDLEAVKSRYCEKDVIVLTEALLKFRLLSVEYTNIDPLQQCTTLASFTLKNYLQNHMKNDVIGCIPRGGYRRRENNSIKCLKWFCVLKEMNVIQDESRFRSVLHPQGEKKIGHFYVDGYDEVTGK